jgi:hypothetical protein
MRVRRRGAGGIIFLRGQVFFYVARDLLPVTARIGMEDICQRAPAAIAGEHGLLRFTRFAAFVFNLPENADRGDVIAGFFLEPALPDPVGVVYPEVVRRRRGRFRCEVAEVEFPEGLAVGDRSPLVFSSWRSAHSCVASSHAAG